MAVSLAGRLDPRALLTIMADGGTRSGERIARELGSSRREVAGLVRRLRGGGIDIRAAAGRGYRLPAPVELLDAGKIRSALRGESGRRVRRLEVLFEVDSTNTHLLDLAAPPAGSANVCLAELQHAGRGRRGRPWISPFGASLALSLGWTLAEAARADPTLSLAVGVAVARALHALGAHKIRLKWPNDIWLDDRKIGGVLAELRADAGGPAYIVIGIGLNVSLPAESRRKIEMQGVRIAAISDICPAAVSRNALAAALLEELLSMLDEFETRGFAAFREEWSVLDALRGRRARVHTGDGAVEGTAQGVDTDGALLLEVGGRLQRHVSGEVSLRLSEGAA